ncbi:tRNA (adenosine(37)-N6)-dimethylallyltransferase MiaA [soil metagenome]
MAALLCFIQVQIRQIHLSNMRTVIVITGPTASGKTALSLELAKHYNTSIISADSRQCFRELNIAVAKPSEAELQNIKHYFINSHSIHDKISAQSFAQYAHAATEEIFKDNNYAVMVGGTGLYIKAFCEGLDEIPETDDSIRKEINENYKAKGLLWLQDEVKYKDPAYWQVSEQQNPQRLMRALEVIISTGASITAFRMKKKRQQDFAIIKIGVDLPKTQLHYNINTRVEKMMRQGLLEEAASLKPFAALNALQTVGYKELFDFFNGHGTLPEAIEHIKINTRKYAKRQLTWLRKDGEIRWLPADFSAALQVLKKN